MKLPPASLILRSALLGLLPASCAAVQAGGCTWAARAPARLLARACFCCVAQCGSPPDPHLLQRTETVPDPAPSPGQQQQQQQQAYVQASGTALRSSSDKLPVGSAVPVVPPVQISPFAGQAGAAVSPFADPPPAQQPAQSDSGATSSSSAAAAAPLVSPFSSGALPAGLDFDQQAVRKHANAVAAAAAAAGRQPGAQQQERGS